MSQKTKELDFNRKLFGWSWLAGIFTCLIFSAKGGAAAVFALIIGLLGTAGVLYMAFKQAAVIESRITGLESEMFRQGSEIQRKIAHNRKLVDS